MNFKFKIIFLSLIFFIKISIFSNTLKRVKEEVAFKATSSLYQENDSINLIDYKLIKRLYEKKEYSEALKKSLIFLEDRKKNKDFEMVALTHSLIGDIFKETRNYRRSLSYFRESLKFYDALVEKKSPINDEIPVDKRTDINFIELLLKLGTAYHNLDKNDSARYYYNELIKINTINKKKLFVISKAYNNLSNLYYYSEKKDFKKAEDFALKAIEIKRKIGDKASEAASIASLANVYLEQKKYEKARKFYLKAINLIENNSDAKSIRFKEIFYENISWAMYNQKKYQAYNYLDKSFKIRDSLREAEIRDILVKIEGRHKVAMEKEKTDLAKSKVELKKLQDRKITLLFSALSLLVLIVSGVVIYNYKLRQNNLELKLSKSELIQQQNIEKLKSESQIKILNATLDGKESERKQIAETLHDSVSSLLSSATLHLQATRTQFNGGTPIEIDKTQAIITEASEKIRDLSHTLVSSVLLKFGLRHAIKDIAEKYSNSAIQIHTDISDIRRYHQGFEIKANNIIQEFINNILKHSKAKNAFISMQEKEEALYVTIEDDGQGFDPKEITNKDGLGINQIEARIKMMKGSLKINSTLGKGTIIKMVLPIVEKEKVSFNLA